MAARSIRSRARWAAGLGLAAALGIVVVIVGQVDDWNRDFSTNAAATSTGATDPLLRPVRATCLLHETVALVTDAALTLPRWAVVQQSVRGDVGVVRLTRTTRVFRFVDDITVRVEDHDSIRVVHVRSTSRVGSADLGQNPRNVRELVGAVRSAAPGRPGCAVTSAP